MCWYSSNTPIKKVAEKPIKVFKLCRGTSIDNTVLPYYYGSYWNAYKLGETYYHDKRLKVLTIGDHIHQIGEGYHSYGVNKFIFERRLDRVRDYMIIRHVDKETNVYANVDTLDIANFYVKLVLCTIPKGATYFKNEYDTYVSDAIRIDSIKEIFEFLTEEN